MSRVADPSRAQRFLVDRMRSIEGLVTASVHDRVTQSGARGLRIAHARVLAELGEGSRPSELAKRLAVTKGAIGQLVALLEERGFVTLEPDPTDRRARIVRPTAKATEAYVVSRRALLAIEQDWRRILGPRRMDELERALEALDGWRP
jgi:DNA-binding MarR family transcriptional regulator